MSHLELVYSDKKQLMSEYFVTIINMSKFPKSFGLKCKKALIISFHYFFKGILVFYYFYEYFFLKEKLFYPTMSFNYFLTNFRCFILRVLNSTKSSNYFFFYKISLLFFKLFRHF